MTQQSIKKSAKADIVSLLPNLQKILHCFFMSNTRSGLSREVYHYTISCLQECEYDVWNPTKWIDETSPYSDPCLGTKIQPQH